MADYLKPEDRIRQAAAAHRAQREASYVAPELPTRAEREFERELDALELNFRERRYSAALKNAQTLVILTHSLAIFGRQGVDVIPVIADGWAETTAALAESMAEKTGKIAVGKPVIGETRNLSYPMGICQSCSRYVDVETGEGHGEHGDDAIIGIVTPYDSPAGAGADVEAERG